MNKLRQTVLIIGEGPTELFFLYYFRYTSHFYLDQDSLIKDLNQCAEYRKTKDFFMNCKGLHNYFERKGGNLESAISNSNKSLEENLKVKENTHILNLDVLCRF